jgi:hypothetical protein
VTLEEAAEEILKGAFTICTHCEGTGNVTVKESVLYIQEEVEQEVMACRSCKGHGKWERGDYLRACSILGVEPVRLPEVAIRTFKHRAWPALKDLLLTMPKPFRMEYMGVWHEPEERCDTADAMAYAMKPTPKSEPVLSSPRRYWPGRYRP